MGEKRFLQLHDIQSYVIAFHLSNYVWNIVVHWDYFAKKTVGSQFVTAVDSISSNVAEGFGRYSKKDKIKFYRYSFGSLKESFDWTQKSKVRKLITDPQYTFIITELNKLPKELHSLIKFTNEKLTM